MRWTSKQFYDYQAKRGTSSAVVERATGDESLATKQVEAGHSGKFVVRITSYRRRLLDEDNLAEKYHVDACRYAGILPSDAPDKTHIEVRQEKVKLMSEERTEIELTKN